MSENQGIVNDVLGHLCSWTNTETDEAADVMVVIKSEVELYQNRQLVGTVTTGVFDKASCDPKIGDALTDSLTGIAYKLDGIKQQTIGKIEFILGEV